MNPAHGRPQLGHLRAIIVAAVMMVCAVSAHATVIRYDLTQLDSEANRWRYDYTVTNDTLADPLEWFTIFFDLELYEDLVVSATPVDWDSLVVQPDAGLPDDGFFDSLALVGGILPGETLGGFSASFTYRGAGAIPGAQRFDVLNLDFHVVASGVTTSGLPVPVPEPSSLFLSAAGLLGAILFRYRRRLPR